MQERTPRAGLDSRETSREEISGADRKGRPSRSDAIRVTFSFRGRQATGRSGPRPHWSSRARRSPVGLLAVWRRHDDERSDSAAGKARWLLLPTRDGEEEARRASAKNRTFGLPVARASEPSSPSPHGVRRAGFQA